MIHKKILTAISFSLYLLPLIIFNIFLFIQFSLFVSDIINEVNRSFNAVLYLRTLYSGFVKAFYVWIFFYIICAIVIARYLLKKKKEKTILLPLSVSLTLSLLFIVQPFFFPIVLGWDNYYHASNAELYRSTNTYVEYASDYPLSFILAIVFSNLLNVELLDTYVYLSVLMRVFLIIILIAIAIPPSIKEGDKNIAILAPLTYVMLDFKGNIYFQYSPQKYALTILTIFLLSFTITSRRIFRVGSVDYLVFAVLFTSVILSHPLTSMLFFTILTLSIFICRNRFIKRLLILFILLFILHTIYHAFMFIISASSAMAYFDILKLSKIISEILRKSGALGKEYSFYLSVWYRYIVEVLMFLTLIFSLIKLLPHICAKNFKSRETCILDLSILLSICIVSVALFSFMSSILTMTPLRTFLDRVPMYASIPSSLLLILVIKKIGEGVCRRFCIIGKKLLLATLAFVLMGFLSISFVTVFEHIPIYAQSRVHDFVARSLILFNAVNIDNPIIDAHMALQLSYYMIKSNITQRILRGAIDYRHANNLSFYFNNLNDIERYIIYSYETAVEFTIVHKVDFKESENIVKQLNEGLNLIFNVGIDLLYIN